MIVGANRRQKQRQSTAAVRAVSAARGNNRGTTRIVIGVVVVVVIAAAVIVGVLVQQHRTSTAAQTVIPALTVPGSTRYPATVDKADATVLVGQPTAKITLDAYEDFLCPICGQFEAANFTGIEQQLEAGRIQVRYHMINLLDSRSDPPGYSTMAANTALAVATAAPDKFVDFHYSLYQKQPEENGTGWTQAQLSNLANRLGVSGSAFDDVVNGRTYDKQVQTNLTNAENDQALWQTNSDGSKGFGTPTIVYDGAPVDWQSTTWLTDLVNTAYPQK
jgi:protein-disulfide isomerase